MSDGIELGRRTGPATRTHVTVRRDGGAHTVRIVGNGEPTDALVDALCAQMVALVDADVPSQNTGGSA